LNSVARKVSELAGDLPTICSNEGYDLKRQGRTWGCSNCPRCGDGEGNKLCVFVGGDSRWRFNCHACGVYGDTADFVAMARKISLGEALKELSAGTPGTKRSGETSKQAANDPAPPANQEALRQVFLCLKEHALDPGPRGYLNQRGISDRTIDMAIHSGQLRMLPTDPHQARKWLFDVVGKDRLIAADLMKEDGSWPAIAFRPLIALEPTSWGAEFRTLGPSKQGPKAIRYGTMQWPWFLKRKAKPQSVLVAEGFIDNLSVIDGIPEADAAMGIPGVNGWKARWFEALKASNPGILVLIGTDNDKAGETCGQKLAECVQSIGLQNLIIHPPHGKDWNDALMARNAIKAETPFF
jgi:hypothetical protein